MCVIFVSEKARPSEDDVRDADESNPDGIGAAWIDAKSGLVRWRKGINLSTALYLAKVLPQPFAMHFRWATVGPRGSALCHPFPLEPAVSLKAKGTCRNGVLMHNGHWGDWEKWIGQRMKSQGPWSDTRVAAWLAHFFMKKEGIEGLEQVLMTVSGKFAHVHEKGITKYGHFDEIGDGLFASNLIFRRSYWTANDYSNVDDYRDIMGVYTSPDDDDPEEEYMRWVSGVKDRQRARHAPKNYLDPIYRPYASNDLKPACERPSVLVPEFEVDDGESVDALELRVDEMGRIVETIKV